MSSDNRWPVAPILCKLCRTESEISSVLLLKVRVFWDVTSCLHLQGHIVDILTLKKKKLRSFLISLSIYQLTRYDIPQDLILEWNSLISTLSHSLTFILSLVSYTQSPQLPIICM